MRSPVRAVLLSPQFRTREAGRAGTTLPSLLWGGSHPSPLPAADPHADPQVALQEKGPRPMGVSTHRPPDVVRAEPFIKQSRTNPGILTTGHPRSPYMLF